MQIRRATSEDTQTLATLNIPVQQVHVDGRPDVFKVRSDGPEMVGYFEDILQKEQNHVFIAEVDGQAVGYAIAIVFSAPETSYSKSSDVIYLNQMSVNDEQRGQGIGTALMQAVFDLARAENVRRLVLNVWHFNSDARAFYEHLGFEPMTVNMELMLD
jgi:diamine N-acetyltransferase